MTGLTNPKFDYDSIDKQEAAKLRYYEGELTKSRKRVADEVIKHGEILCGAREVLANHTDGVFCAWLDSVGISRRSAYNAMDAFTAFGGFANLQNIEVSAMYELAKSEDAKKRAMKLADRNVKVTHGMAKAILEDIAEKQEVKSTSDKRVSAIDASDERNRQALGRQSRTALDTPAPTIEPHVAALDEQAVDVSPVEPVETVVEGPPADKCPNCAAIKWTRDGDGWACGKCHHPYGEPVGDVDSKRVNEARSLAVKYSEALMRSIDDFNHICPHRTNHDATIELVQKIWAILKAWK